MELIKTERKKIYMKLCGHFLYIVFFSPFKKKKREVDLSCLSTVVARYPVNARLPVDGIPGLPGNLTTCSGGINIYIGDDIRPPKKDMNRQQSVRLIG